MTAEICGLNFQIGRQRRRESIVAIENIDLRSGEMVTFSGPSGSGKSTLLYLISGLLRPTAGSVIWNGKDLAGIGEVARDRWRRQHAGFVFQNFHLIDELTPLENVLAPVWFSAFRNAGLRTRASELLDRFGVPQGRGRAGLLSRGEQQRVALARALIFDPAVIFADEPTASLDAESAFEVANSLAALARDENRLVIAASHDDALHRLTDRRIAIEHGRISKGISA